MENFWYYFDVVTVRFTMAAAPAYFIYRVIKHFVH